MPALREVTDSNIIAKVRAAVGARGGSSVPKSNAMQGRKEITDPAIIAKVRAAALAQSRISGAFEAAADQPEANLIGRGRSALEGAGQGLTLGFGDEGYARGSSVTRKRYVIIRGAQLGFGRTS